MSARNEVVMLKEVELVENPPSAAPTSRSEVIQMVAFINDHIDELGDRMSRISRYGHHFLLVTGYGVIPVTNFQLTPVAVFGCLRSEYGAWIHVEADGPIVTSLEVYAPVVSAALEDGLSNEINLGDYLSANPSLIALVTNRFVTL
jgi:hypothetical protein